MILKNISYKIVFISLIAVLSASVYIWYYHEDNKINYFHIGNHYHTQNQHDDAIIAYKKAIEINSNHAKAYANLCRSYFYKGFYKKAIQACKKSINIDSTFAEAYTTLGSSYANMRDYDKAISSFHKALEINPDYEKAKYNLSLAQRLKY